MHWFLCYRGLNEKYDNDIDLELDNNDKEMFTRELDHLKEHNIKIVDSDKKQGYAIIKDYKKNDLVPALNFQPYQAQCSKKGYPCEACSNNCDSWKTCKLK